MNTTTQNGLWTLYVRRNGIPDNLLYIAGTYLHGKLENDFGFDLVEIDTKFTPSEGIHHFSILQDKKQRKLILYLWSNPLKDSIHPWRGLYVYADDKDANEYAKKSFELKSTTL